VTVAALKMAAPAPEAENAGCKMAGAESKVPDAESQVLVIACGALAREILWLCESGGWLHFKLQCLPAKLHNRPQRIPEAVRRQIHAGRRRGHRRIFIAYGDCGSGGLLDRMIAEENAAAADGEFKIERLPGAHCYEFYAGGELFQSLSEAEPGTFYLTDFLTRHFERLIIQGLGVDRHPQLAEIYFAHYKKIVYLSQRDDAQLRAAAASHAARLGLAFEHRACGYGELGLTLARIAQPQPQPQRPGA